MFLQFNKLFGGQPPQPSSLNEDGFTLVELLVAIALGLLLTTFLIQSYLSTKQTYELTQGIGRVQENGRFATHFLSEHIRKAGNLGCIDYVRTKLNNERLVNFTSPITGWDYLGTGSDQANYTLPELTVESDSSMYQSTRQQGLGATADGSIINGFRNRIDPIKGSDILIINSVEETDVILNQVPALNSETLTTVSPHDFPQGQLVMVGDCFVADLLQLGSTAPSEIRDVRDITNGNPTNTNNTADRGWSHFWGPATSVYAVDSAAYYVGMGARGVPSLFRHFLDRGHTRGQPQELVEGVETFQVLYGEDTSAPSDGLPNRYISANAVGDWTRVVSTRIGLLLRSESVFSGDVPTGVSFMLADGLEITPADDDGLFRYAFNTTLKPRNTGSVRTYIVERARDVGDYQRREAP